MTDLKPYLDFEAKSIDPKTLKIGFNKNMVKNLKWLNTLAALYLSQSLDLEKKETNELLAEVLTWSTWLERLGDRL